MTPIADKIFLRSPVDNERVLRHMGEVPIQLFLTNLAIALVMAGIIGLMGV